MHFDPSSASAVFRSATTKAVLPLEITNQVTFDVDFLNTHPPKYTRAGSILHSLVSHLFRMNRQHRAQETITLNAALGIVYLLEPMLFESSEYHIEVKELGGIDPRCNDCRSKAIRNASSRVEIVNRVDVDAVRDCIIHGLKIAGQETGVLTLTRSRIGPLAWNHLWVLQTRIFFELCMFSNARRLPFEYSLTDWV